MTERAMQIHNSCRDNIPMAGHSVSDLKCLWGEMSSGQKYLRDKISR
jgi:hypothetical protein